MALSFTQRLRDVLRANLNELVDRAAEMTGDVSRLAAFSDEQLERELAERRMRRQVQEDRARIRNELDRARSGESHAGVAATGQRFSATQTAAPRGADPKLADYYSRLELPYGADYEQVRISYRSLMRRYHPDLFGRDAARQKMANDLSQSLTEAHNELERVLMGGPNRSRP